MRSQCTCVCQIATIAETLILAVTQNKSVFVSKKTAEHFVSDTECCHAFCVESILTPFSADFLTCHECKHKGYAREMRAFANCPLCHTPLKK
jgi:hypothetical protein